MIIGWGHEYRNGILKNEIYASLTSNRYSSTFLVWTKTTIPRCNESI